VTQLRYLGRNVFLQTGRPRNFVEKTMESKPHYYHCATKGFKHSILYASVREFVAGMNRIAFCQARSGREFPVIVVAFCLMDNHVHFILYGRREDVLKWMALYHKLTMIWQTKHRDGSPVSEAWEYDAWRIVDKEDLKEKIAYVLRNPMAAGQAVVPTNYRWSSAGLVFSAGPDVTGTPVREMSSYHFRKIFETRIELPDDWMLMPDGLIWPGCYTQFQQVENLFGQPSAFLFALNQRVEAKVNQEMAEHSVSLPDYDITRMAQEAAKEQYGSPEIETLDLSQRIVLCGLLVKRPGVNLKQLARIFNIPPDDLRRIFGLASGGDSKKVPESNPGTMRDVISSEAERSRPIPPWRR